MGLNIPHLHLLLNHVPTVGSVAGLGLLLLALVRRNDDLMRASLEMLFVVALASLPVFLTGVAAKQAIGELDGVVAAAMDTHEDAAFLAFISMQITGLAAWLGLWWTRRRTRPSGANVGTVLLFSVLTTALMARAAAIGGEIRHPEIVVGQAAAAGAPAGWLSARTIGGLVTGYTWVWPAAETLHFIGLCLVFGVLLAANLRILGMMKSVPFAALHALLPWGVLGFVVNLVTGVMFFMGTPTQYTGNIMFLWKVLLLTVAGAQFLFLTVLGRTWSLKAGDDAWLFDKLVAALGIGSWLGVIFAGRMLPFIGNAY